MDGLILPCREYFPAARNNAGVAETALDIWAGDEAVPAVLDAVHTNRAVLTFPDAAAAFAQLQTRLPSDLYVPGGLALSLLWSTPASSGNVQWTAATAFVMPIDGDQDDLDPVFNAATEVVSPASAAADCLIKSEFAALDVTGARPGAVLFLAIGRDATNSDDDLVDDVHLLGVELQYQRRVVLP